MFLLLFPLWEKCRSKWNIGTSLYLKLKPFFDAYAGPHTDMFRFWPGLLLVARVFVSFIVIVNFTNVVNIILVAVIVALIATLSFVKVYKNPKLKQLEIFYNLTLVGTFYILTGQANITDANNFNAIRKGLIAPFTFAFVLFASTVLYHLYSLKCTQKCIFRMKNGTKFHRYLVFKDEKEDGLIIKSTSTTMSRIPTMYVPECREPVIEYQM